MRSMLAIGFLAALVTARAWPQCQTPEHRQFDFWVGDWDAYDLPDTAVAVARIQVTRIMDGCALREVYAQEDGLERAVVRTFDGKNACKLCRLVAEGKKNEKKTERELSIKKLELASFTASLIFLAGQLALESTPYLWAPESRQLQPPTPPPDLA